MTSSSLLRLSGLAALVAAVLFLISELLSLATQSESMSESATTLPFALTYLLLLLGSVLLLAGLVGLYVRQSEATGILGLVSFALAFFGTVLLAGAVWAQLFIAPFLATTAPGALDTEPTGGLAVGFTLSFGLAPLGFALLGLAMFRARVFPRASAIALMVGGALSFLPIPLSGIVFYPAMAWLGFLLFTGVGLSTEKPSSPRVS